MKARGNIAHVYTMYTNRLGRMQEGSVCTQPVICEKISFLLKSLWLVHHRDVTKYNLRYGVNYFCFFILSKYFFHVALVPIPDKPLGQNLCACILPRPGLSLSSTTLLRHFEMLCLKKDRLGIIPAYFLLMKSFPVSNENTDKHTWFEFAI